ncbi:hypothetical protein ACIQOW_20270 [Kitasatospora sp. NPDC091335]|uniref:hypothetical protein n=1 Tax=Kitasatospora sp. NPDC091335 TaxID=3364085 RepID=UPI0037FA3970
MLLTPDGFGRILSANRRAALRWADLLTASGELELYQHPDLDIVTYFPATADASLSSIDAASQRLLRDAMTAEADPVFLSVLRADAGAFTRRHPHVAADAEAARVMRSVLIKPEFEHYLPTLHARVEDLAAGVRTTA